MTNKKILFIVSVMAIVATILVGCNQQEMVSPPTITTKIVTETTSEGSTVTTTESTTQKVKESSTMKNTTTKAKESSTVKNTTTSTTAKATTKPPTTKSTTKLSTTIVQTTAKKVTTTKKTTTKPKTTEPPYFCDEGGTHHSCAAGPIGWVNSFEEAKQKALRYIDAHADSGSFRVNDCQYCGKYTATVTLD